MKTTKIKEAVEELFFAEGAYWSGSEFITAPPYNRKAEIGSFTIDIDRMVYVDFATRESGSIVDLTAAARQCSELEACQFLGIPQEAVTAIGYGRRKPSNTAEKQIPIEPIEWSEPQKILDIYAVIMDQTIASRWNEIFTEFSIPVEAVSWRLNCEIQELRTMKPVSIIPPYLEQAKMVVVVDSKEQDSFVASKILAKKTGAVFIELLSKAEMVDRKIVKGKIDSLLSILGDYDGITEIALSDAFAAMYGTYMRFHIERQAWMYWDEDDSVWVDDGYGGVYDLYRRFCAELARLNKALSRSIQSYTKFRSIMFLAKQNPSLRCSERDFDKELYKVKSGSLLIDLITGKVRQVESSDYITQQLGCRYNPDATCPMFIKFINEIFFYNTDMVEFIQRLFGLCLSGDVSPEVFVVFYGIGANGKSTLLSVIKHVLGTYAKEAAPETFVAANKSAIANDIAMLKNIRLVVTSELPGNKQLDENRLKAMTGSDSVTARFLYSEYFEFLPQWKIIMATNHRPKIVGTDYGIWRRLLLIPFDYVCITQNQDPTLKEKLITESPGILNWMIEGFSKYWNDGRGRKALKVPPAIDAYIEEFHDEENALRRYIKTECYTTAEECLMVYSRNSCPLEVLYEAFLNWAQAVGVSIPNLTMSGLKRRLLDMGYRSKPIGGRYYYEGIYPKEATKWLSQATIDKEALVEAYQNG